IDGLMVSGELVPVGSAEHGYRVFVEAMDEGAITVAADGTILYSNRGFAELAQVPLETVSGRNVFEFIAESDRPAFEAGLREAQQGTAKLEVVLQRGDGRDIPAFLSLKSFRPSESPVVSIVVTDLTEQKRNQEIVAAGKLART